MDNFHIALFAKKKKTKEGREFWAFSTKLPKKDGSGEVYFDVKFKEGCNAPKSEQCPMYIDVERDKVSRKTEVKKGKNEVDEDIEYTVNTLFIGAYTVSDEKYVDHSMDEF